MSITLGHYDHWACLRRVYDIVFSLIREHYKLNYCVCTFDNSIAFCIWPNYKHSNQIVLTWINCVFLSFWLVISRFHPNNFITQPFYRDIFSLKFTCQISKPYHGSHTRYTTYWEEKRGGHWQQPSLLGLFNARLAPRDGGRPLCQDWPARFARLELFCW